ncbi:MAG: hypothetical protein N2646_05785, partial [Bellilinea sp.]|nr:hypothetical protein [Bellilinea sp.]
DNSSIYSHLAQQIVQRERAYEQQLDQPPDYQFWKKAGWKAKWSGFWQQRAWSLGILAVVFISALVLVAVAFQNNSQRSSATPAAVVQQTPRPTPSVTALPVNKRPRISYTAGEFSIIRIENPTHRMVLSNANSDPNTAAVPAVGAVYLAVQYEFLCRAALCENPPEAEIALKLEDGSVVSYTSSYRPVLAEFPGVARIAKNQTVTGWLVFEIPNQAAPAALLFPNDAGYDAPPLELPWPR